MIGPAGTFAAPRAETAAKYTVKHFNPRGRYLDAVPAYTEADVQDVVADLTKANPKNHRFEVWAPVLDGICLSAVYRNGKKVTP